MIRRIVLGIQGILILAAIGLIILSVACKPRAAPTLQDRAQAESQQKDVNRQRAEQVAGMIIYLREPKTGLCFAYMFEAYGSGDWAYGGPALATVDCDKVAAVIANAPPTPEAPAAPTPPQTAP